MSVTITPVTGAASTVSIPDGTFDAQASLIFAPDFSQRLQLATGLTIQAIDGEDAGAPNHTNRLVWARNAALDIATTSKNLQILVLADGSITATSNNQQIFDALQAVMAKLIFSA